MSHLPLDARAILQYLNELGYRNISAEQLKEFMKGMQRQSEISSSSRSKTQQKPKGSSSSTTQQQQQQHKLSTAATPTKRTSARVSSPKQSQQQQQPPQRTPIKIIRSKKPLIHFKFYLDICDHQQTKKIEEKIKQLGGTLEFFLTPNVTHFVTDKSVLPPTVSNNNNTLSSRPGTPQTPQTNYSPYDSPAESATPSAAAKSNVSTPSGSRRAPSAIRQTRADAILNRARRGAAATAAIKPPTKDFSPALALKTSPKLDSNSKEQPYVVWQTEQALRFFAKVQNDLKDVLVGAAKREHKSHHHSSGSKSSSRAFGPTHLKGSFIKIESLKRNYRPYYQLFKKPAEWPKIELTREDGAFRLSPKKELDNISEDNKKMTRKSRSRSSQRQQPQQTQPPLPAAVQALKKTNADNSLKSSGQKHGTANCKQAAKESSEKQCGVCEICKIEYDTLTIHLKTKDHEYFAKNSQNFIALDTLIHSSADVNKFLAEEQNANMELEEMEVEEQDVNSETIAAHDPLEDSLDQQLNKRYNSDNTPSPTLREKSKRSTKGKHSSEKFQQASRTSKSPKSAANTTTTATASATKNSSPKKQAAALKVVVTAANDEHCMGTRQKTATATNASSASAVYSPPIRAMLPPSSMYKVVDATPAAADVNTPARKAQAGAAQVVNSPSLIVKFKKVRETELCRLSGEADRFMFRKQRTSSELPTDLDRQTTSDHNLRANHSSTSLESSINDSAAEMATSLKTEATTKATQGGEQKKAIAVGRRRKGSTTTSATTSAATLETRRFPSTPIQPEIQLKNKLIATANTRRLSLPEATRKSSRTATAIVTAATTSSRLLRAAVEAAKKAGSNEPAVMPKAATETSPGNKITRHSRLSVAKVEDRMGEDDNESKPKTTTITTSKEHNDIDALKFSFGLFADDDDIDLDDDEITEDDAEKDEDFILNTKLPKQTPTKRAAVDDDVVVRHTTREERAARRWTQRFEALEVDIDEEAEVEEPVVNKKRRKLTSKTNSSKKQTSKESELAAPLKKVVLSSPPQRHYDIMKSARLPKMRYAFERLPASDLWFRVYTRQDVCEERYFEYYGSTQYRKLPYEMGPIPFDYTLAGPAAKCCTLCQKAGRLPKPEAVVEVKKEATTAQEPATEVKTSTVQTTNTNSYMHKHKKLHLLQRYHQELLQEQQQKQASESHKTTSTSTSTAANATSKCDSKASTPDREREHERDCERIKRAGSTQSNTSSCTVSSTGTLNSQHKYRNKHLNKVNLLNLELPPRKSPREHASTLALVSCIIRQRQDSLSKPNSETDEPAAMTQTTPASPLPSIEDDVKSIKAALKQQNKTPVKMEATEAITNATTTTITTTEPRTTRSAAATPVEELRFATEISETVKRMRRGQNKYDHSPPIVLKTKRSTRGKSKVSLTASPPLDRHSFNARKTSTVLETLQPPTPSPLQNEEHTNQRRRPRSLLLPAMSELSTTLPRATTSATTTSSGVRRRIFGGRSTKLTKSKPAIRKTGSKKGVLEFEMDAAALKTLKASMAPKPSARQLEWQIDKYLEFTAKDYDCDELSEMLLKMKEREENSNKEASSARETETTIAPTVAAAIVRARKTTLKHAKSQAATNAATTTSTTTAAAGVNAFGDVNTPPPTDCFSSDFDLYDLFTSKGETWKLGAEMSTNSKPTNFSLYSSVAVQNYFRRRKATKSNRTGWPKAQKKKNTNSLRHQHLLRQKGRYKLTNGAPLNGEQAVIKAELGIDEDSQDVASMNGGAGGDGLVNNENDNDGVMTPPESEIDDNATVLTNDDGDADDYENENDDDDDDDDAVYLDAIDDTVINGLDGGDTIADSIEIERCCTADLENDAAVEADIEEANDDDGADADFEDDTTTMFMEQRNVSSKKRLTLRQRQRSRSNEVISPILLKRTANSLHPVSAAAAGNSNAGTVSLTSTPSRTTAATTPTLTTTTTAGTANMLRGLRRTPVLLNGSLGSCISPSEKAGDNSDIFTVSSDGLDTDLDLSNSHTEMQQDLTAHCTHRTPKRTKYDITKYAPNSKNPRTCAAEAATAAVKSLAISQFLKKEVRVTCRRLRPPFRRFRFRR